MTLMDVINSVRERLVNRMLEETHGNIESNVTFGKAHAFMEALEIIGEELDKYFAEQDEWVEEIYQRYHGKKVEVKELSHEAVPS